jgi:outer membrane autotransporter protein
LSGNGTFMMNTDLADLRGDLIKVQGEISGNHTLVVADSGKAPANPYALALVDGNGGHGSFSLYGKTVDAGAFRYELQHVGEDWYLMNSADVDPINDPDGSKVPPVDPVTPVTPIAPTTPVNPVTPVNPQEKPAIPAELAKPAQPVHRPQAQTLSKGANAAVASHAASAALISAQMSATLGHFGELRSGKDQGGLWTRGYGAEQHLDTGASRAFDQQINGFEVGADKAMSFADGTLYVGALFGQGKGRQSFGEASKGTTDSTTLGGYASYLDRSGLYVDGTVKYSRLDNETKITSNLGNKVKAKFKNHAVTADVQVGKHIDLSQGWFVEPQAGLQVTRISGSRYAASNGLTVEQDAMLSVQSRIGGVVGRDLKLDNGMTVKPYAKANWITEHAGKSNVKVSGAKLDSRLPGSRAEIGGGVMISVADKHNLYAEATYTKGRGIEQPMAVTVGYRYTW